MATKHTRANPTRRVGPVPDAAQEWVLSLLRQTYRRDDIAATLMYIRHVYGRTGTPLSTRQLMDGLEERNRIVVLGRLRILCAFGLVAWQPWQRHSIRPIDLPPP